MHRLMRQDLVNLKQDLDQAERVLRDAQDRVRAARQELIAHDRAAKEFVVQIQRQEERVTELKDQLEEATPQTGLLDSYREELKKAESDEAILSNQFEDFVIEKRRLNGQARELKNKLNDIDNELASAAEEVKNVQARHDQVEQRRYEILLEKNKAVQAVEDAQTRLRGLQTSRERAQEDLLGITAEASEQCERVPLDRGKTTSDFENAFQVLQRTIAKAKET